MNKTDLFEWIIGYRKLKALSVACDLEVFTLLAEGYNMVSTLAERTGSQPKPLKALLDAFVGFGLLDHAEGQYSNMALAEDYLVKGKPRYLGDLIYVFACEATQWDGLGELISKGEAPPFISVSSQDSQRFTMAMHSLGMLGEAEAFADAVSLQGNNNLVDVGCGSGVYSITLLKQNPGLKATLFDRAEVLKTTERVVSESGVTDRITLQPGDFLKDSYGDDRDLVLLSDVLYGPPDVCRKMLSSAYEALTGGGRIIIRGYFSDLEGSQPPFAALFDLGRLLWLPENEPLTVSGVKAWLVDVGFSSIESFLLATGHSTCITAQK